MKNKWDEAGTLPSTHLKRPVDCRMSFATARRRRPLSPLAPINLAAFPPIAPLYGRWLHLGTAAMQQAAQQIICMVHEMCQKNKRADTTINKRKTAYNIVPLQALVPPQQALDNNRSCRPCRPCRRAFTQYNNQQK